jgi:predicted negative regulator of RcsB-dependent stress response
MNNVYENNMRFVPFLKFLDKYKKIIVAIFILVILAITFFIISNQIEKQNNEEASVLYSEWLEELSNENPNLDNLNTILNQLLEDYKNTGYTKLALLSKANMDAKSNEFNQALENFNILIDLTNGFGGNKIFNKMARVSAARILLAQDRYEEALKMVDTYSFSGTNGYIHELTGDILVKQNKNNLAITQYELAAAKYSDETSKSIISMKIANIGT